MQYLAFQSISKSVWAREYYDEKRALGKRHHEALRMVAHKWVKVIFAMRRDQTVYDEESHLKMKAEHAVGTLN